MIDDRMVCMIGFQEMLQCSCTFIRRCFYIVDFYRWNVDSLGLTASESESREPKRYGKGGEHDARSESFT